MPILISQIVMKPSLYALAVINTVILGAFAFLLFAPSGASHLATSLSLQSHSSSDPARHSAQFDPYSGQSLPPNARSTSGAPSAPAPRMAPAAVSRVVLAASVSGDMTPSFVPASTFDETSAKSSAASALDVASETPARQPAHWSAPAQIPAQSTYYSNPLAAYVPAAAAAQDVPPAPPAPPIPLAFTTPTDGATPSQAAALNRLQREFSDTINSGQNQDPNSPAYSQAWQDAQKVSDSNFEQQFGTQAFIQAQLAVAHGAAAPVSQ